MFCFEVTSLFQILDLVDSTPRRHRHVYQLQKLRIIGHSQSDFTRS